MAKNRNNYPTGEGIGPASVRGESILDHYMMQMPTYDGICEAAADMIADVLAYLECERRVNAGEAEAEGGVSRFPSPESVMDDAASALETLIVDYAHREAALAEAFERREQK
jgi:hypothetical protein